MSAVVVVGSCNLDLIVEVPVLPHAGQTVLGRDVTVRPGGKGANQAVAARRLGARTTFIGAVGDDHFGQTLRDALESERLDLTQLTVVNGPSGIALIVVDRQGANQIAVAPGANGRLGAEHLVQMERSLGHGDVLLLQLEIPLGTCLAAARIAEHAGAAVVLNAAPLTGQRPGDLDALLALTDVLVVNEEEASALLGGRAAATADDWIALARLATGRGPRAAVVTLGARGAVAAAAGEAFSVPAFPVDAVDTTGAGDALCGALAAALSEGRPLRDALRLGCAAGAIATTAVGAQSAMPTTREIEQLYASAGAA